MVYGINYSIFYYFNTFWYYIKKLIISLPDYQLLKSWGPDHARRFEIGVYLGEKLLGKGLGKNKQEAAQNAAKDALSRLKG